MVALKLFHISPTSGRVSICKRAYGFCTFGATLPHFTAREASVAHGKLSLEEALAVGLSGEPKELPLTEDLVRKRLGLLSHEELRQLVWEHHRLSNAPGEATVLVEADAPVHVFLGGNREVTMELDTRENYHAYMHGGCSLLAAEIHRATGWPIEVYSYPPEGGYWSGHVTIQTPRGGHLDIQGEYTQDPRKEFGPAGMAMVKSLVDIQELTRLVDSRASTVGNNLALLDRQLTAQLAFQLLKTEGYLTL